jgi:hypothetical protein
MGQGHHLRQMTKAHENDFLIFFKLGMKGVQPLGVTLNRLPPRGV